MEKVGHLWAWPMPAEKALLLSYRNKADDIWRHKVGLLFGAFELNKSEINAFSLLPLCHFSSSFILLVHLLTFVPTAIGFEFWCLQIPALSSVFVFIYG